MPIQAPLSADYLSCPVCGREFSAPSRSPISLSCGHTVCKNCVTQLPRNQCPFDQSFIQTEPEELVVNTALLQLAGYTPPVQPYRPPSIQALPLETQRAYDIVVQRMEELASYLRYCNNANGNESGFNPNCRLSRPMQRKLVTLVQCAVIDPEGRGRAARAARSLAERTVTELTLQHQNCQQLSVNLWAAVRARGCQFLGPAMQEEVLKLVLIALDDGAALSRKVLVMFVVQRLEPQFPQASKTSIGHVVQLLYRASCFKVSKRESDSSLMQLKEEFRTYESLRREHDAQIVQIATESGLRIGPDQWSALLYGDTSHKSHMQSIIDKLQGPQSLVQSVQELLLMLHRLGEHTRLVRLHPPLDTLVDIDSRPDAKNPSWQTLSDNLTALKDLLSALVHYQNPPATNREVTIIELTSDQPDYRSPGAVENETDTTSKGYFQGDTYPATGCLRDLDSYPVPQVVVPTPLTPQPLVPSPSVPYMVVNDQDYVGQGASLPGQVALTPDARYLSPPSLTAPTQPPQLQPAFYPYPMAGVQSNHMYTPVLPSPQYNWPNMNYHTQGVDVGSGASWQSRMPFVHTPSANAYFYGLPYENQTLAGPYPTAPLHSALNAATTYWLGSGQTIREGEVSVPLPISAQPEVPIRLTSQAEWTDRYTDAANAAMVARHAQVSTAPTNYSLLTGTNGTTDIRPYVASGDSTNELNFPMPQPICVSNDNSDDAELEQRIEEMKQRLDCVLATPEA